MSGMGYRFEKVTGRYLGTGEPQGANEVHYTGAFDHDEDGIDMGVVWDDALQNMRLRTDAEKLVIAKVKKRAQLKRRATVEAALIYDFITSPDFYLFALDLYTSTIPAARSPLSGRLLQFKAVKDVYDGKKAEIDALTTIVAVLAYDLDTGWP